MHRLGANLVWLAAILVATALVLVLTGCTLGEAVMPNPASAEPADRLAGLVFPVPAPIPHTLEGRQECFTCHAIGAVDAPPVPADHDEEVALCTTCHAVWLAPDIAAAAPPAIPHELEGRGDCLVCHKLGTADAPRIPNNHGELSSDICQACHTAVSQIPGAGGTDETPMAEPPPIPHPLDGFGACSQCHAGGGPGIPQLPADHQGRTDDLCSACHSPAAETAAAAPIPAPPATPTEISSTSAGDSDAGQVIFSTGCAPCHGSAGEGTAIAPDALNASLLGMLTDEDLTAVIRSGVTGKMPAFSKLSDQDLQDLIALLRSWP